MSTEKEIIIWVNKNFDRLIKAEKKFKVFNKSEIYKKLFNLTINFTNVDWKNIRTKNYWEQKEKLTFEEKLEFTLKSVVNYINNKN